jgi:uncharacterized protein (TIGR03435 family)
MKFHILAAGVAISALAIAQNAAHPQFEVASIKPNHSADGRSTFMMAPGGRMVATNVPVKMLILMAFELRDNQLSGLPGWADSDRFDITAKPEDGSGIKPDDTHAMIRALLMDRFKLTFHKETKEMPIFALVAGKGGSKLAPSKGNADFDDEASSRATSGPGRGRGQGVRITRGEINGQNVTVDMLTDQLSRIVGRSVIDQTGLKGSYDFTLKYLPDTPAPLGRGPESSDAAPSDSQMPSIFAAVQEQLGLKLEAQRGPVDMYIVDRLEKPSEN